MGHGHIKDCSIIVCQCYNSTHDRVDYITRSHLVMPKAGLKELSLSGVHLCRSRGCIKCHLITNMIITLHQATSQLSNRRRCSPSQLLVLPSSWSSPLPLSKLLHLKTTLRCLCLMRIQKPLMMLTTLIQWKLSLIAMRQRRQQRMTGEVVKGGMQGLHCHSRTLLCQLSGQFKCGSACAGQLCTATCTATCGSILPRVVTFLCSAVAATTCTAATG